MEENIFLGIDPGTVKMGYGLLSKQNRLNNVIDYGIIKLPSNMRLTEKNFFIFQAVRKLILDYGVCALVIESQFIGKNVRAAFTLNTSLAIAMLAATEQAVPVYSYTPTEVKLATAGHGHTSKLNMQQMVQQRLQLDTLPLSDAADALALLICHLQRQNSVLSVKEAI